MDSSEKNELFHVSKLEAARRQLATAIELWFHDRDPVSIHTLAFAAYEIIHVVSKKRNRTKDLLFDSAVIKDEYRAEWNKIIKRPANFFKHAKDDAEDSLEYSPKSALLFLLFSIAGLRSCGESLTPVEATFLLWVLVNRPKWVTGNGQQVLTDRVPVENIETMRGLSKAEFFVGSVAAHKRDKRP